MNQPPDDAGPPAGPFNIPFARPVTLQADTTLPTAGAYGPRTIGRLRALIEMLILIPAALLGIVFTVGPLSFLRLADTRWYNLTSSVGMGCGALLACAAMLIIDRHKPASIGLTRRNWLLNIGLGAAALATFYACFVIPLSISFPKLAQQGEHTRQAIEQTFPPMNFAWIALLMTFVVFWEEVVFRGFVLTRMRVIFGRWWLAIPVCSFVFGAIHYYQGMLAVCMISVLALVMSILFAWRRSLVPSMTLHWLFNVGSVLLIKYFSDTWK